MTKVECFTSMLGGRPDWLRWWYGGLDIPIGLSVFALLIAIIAAAWVFYDSQQRDWNPIWYKVAGVVTTILIIPSAITFLAPCWTLDQGLINSLPLLAAVGVVGVSEPYWVWPATVLVSGQPNRCTPVRPADGQCTPVGITAPTAGQQRSPLRLSPNPLDRRVPLSHRCQRYPRGLSRTPRYFCEPSRRTWPGSSHAPVRGPARSSACAT